MAGPIPPDQFQFEQPEAGSPASSALMRRLFRALAQTSLTRDASKPENPRPGMMRVNAVNLNSVNLEMYWEGQWVVLLANIFNLSPWPSYSSHTFSPAASSWVITHGRGRKPLVQVLDASGQVITPTSIIHNSDDQLTITHGSAITGTAIIIG